MKKSRLPEREVLAAIRESQVEDVFATYPTILKSVLNLKDDLSLLARQMSLPSGRLDLLLVAGNRLLLVELKVEPFASEYIHQVKAYIEDLIALQKNDLLINGAIEAYLLCPKISTKQKHVCLQDGIVPIEYSPEEVLERFFAQLKAVSHFVTIRPSDQGLWSIHLINRALYTLPRVSDKQELAESLGRSIKTVSNQLHFAEELCLVRTDGRTVRLTDLGKQYVWNRDSNAPMKHVSEGQASVLRNFIVKDPFATATIFGIYTIVETVFTLSRNSYPVTLETLMPFFRDTCGKHFEWSKAKTCYHGVRMYSNYAIELGLLGRVGNKFYLTPEGLRFVLLLQLHKGLKVIDALRISPKEG